MVRRLSAGVMEVQPTKNAATYDIRGLCRALNIWRRLGRREGLGKRTTYILVTCPTPTSHFAWGKGKGEEIAAIREGGYLRDSQKERKNSLFSFLVSHQAV
jgi:hypothetical protein